MNRRQANKWTAKDQKERRMLIREMHKGKQRKPRRRQWWKAFEMRWKAEWRKEMENEPSAQQKGCD